MLYGFGIADIKMFVCGLTLGNISHDAKHSKSTFSCEYTGIKLRNHTACMNFTIALQFNPINLMILRALIIGQFSEHVNYLTSQLLLARENCY